MQTLTGSFRAFQDMKTRRGQGRGQGYNLNRSLGQGTTDEKYQPALVEVLEQIQAFQPRYLVVSLGLDTHAADPIGGFALTTEYFTRMA